MPWQTPGAKGAADVAGTADGQTTIGSSPGWLNIDVTDAAVAWTSGDYPNHGVWLVPVGATQLYRYTSSNENSLFGLLAGNRPKLTASYLLPCGASAPA